MNNACTNLDVDISVGARPDDDLLPFMDCDDNSCPRCFTEYTGSLYNRKCRVCGYAGGCCD